MWWSTPNVYLHFNGIQIFILFFFSSSFEITFSLLLLHSGVMNCVCTKWTTKFCFYQIIVSMFTVHIATLFLCIQCYKFMQFWLRSTEWRIFFFANRTKRATLYLVSLFVQKLSPFFYTSFATMYILSTLQTVWS